MQTPPKGTTGKTFSEVVKSNTIPPLHVYLTAPEKLSSDKLTLLDIKLVDSSLSDPRTYKLEVVLQAHLDSKSPNKKGVQSPKRFICTLILWDTAKAEGL